MVSSKRVHLSILFNILCISFSKANSITKSAETKTINVSEKTQDTPKEDIKLNQSPFNGASSKDLSNSKNDVLKLTKDFKLPPREFLNTQQSIRNHKMLDYFAYFPEPIIPPYQPPEYYTQHGYYNQNPIEVDDYMSRANRRRPSGNENSPIYYIRLPPTPYMFVPGMGYISQPPSIQPLTHQYSMPTPVPVNSFVNVPVNFLSNGKPTNVYQWNGSPAFGPQYPSYLPARPQHRPGYRPKPYLHDSKITHLKGPYVFNGRPEDVYVLPTDPYQQHPSYRPHYSSNSYNSHAYNSPMYTPYNSNYNTLYSEPIQNFY